MVKWPTDNVETGPLTSIPSVSDSQESAEGRIGPENMEFASEMAKYGGTLSASNASRINVEHKAS